MTENACIFLVAGGITADLSHLYIVAGEGGVVEHHAVLGVEMFLARIKSLLHQTVLESDSGHGAEALTLDEDFTFFVILTTNLITIEIVCA